MFNSYEDYKHSFRRFSLSLLRRGGGPGACRFRGGDPPPHQWQKALYPVFKRQIVDIETVVTRVEHGQVFRAQVQFSGGKAENDEVLAFLALVVQERPAEVVFYLANHVRAGGIGNVIQPGHMVLVLEPDAQGMPGELRFALEGVVAVKIAVASIRILVVWSRLTGESLLSPPIRYGLPSRITANPPGPGLGLALPSV